MKNVDIRIAGRVLKYILYALIVLLAVKLAQVMIVSGAFLENYRNGRYAEQDLAPLEFLNIQESYILPYNLGNVAYKNNNYKVAIARYKRALELGPVAERVCDVRVNLALSMVADFVGTVEVDPDSENLSVAPLEEALVVLRTDNCANAEDTGRSEQAETLEAEIEAMLEQLQQGGSSGKDDDSSGKDEAPGQQVQEDPKEAQLNERTDGAIEGKNEKNEVYGWLDEEEYYHGQRW